MITRASSLVLAAVMCGAGPASAQRLHVQVGQGRVTIVADSVPACDIIAQWARIGGIDIINAERITRQGLTVNFEDVPETRALETLLRESGGYMALLRDLPENGTGSVLKSVIVFGARAVIAPPVSALGTEGRGETDATRQADTRSDHAKAPAFLSLGHAIGLPVSAAHSTAVQPVNDYVSLPDESALAAGAPAEARKAPPDDVQPLTPQSTPLPARSPTDYGRNGAVDRPPRDAVETESAEPEVVAVRDWAAPPLVGEVSTEPEGLIPGQRAEGDPALESNPANPPR
jgi:hypothetical protein